MSTDYYLVSHRSRSFIYVGYSWGAGMKERTASRRDVADFLSYHIGESVEITADPPDEYEEKAPDRLDGDSPPSSAAPPP